MSTTAADSVAAVVAVDYGLPAADNDRAWAALMRPCTGNLQMLQSAFSLPCLPKATTRVTLVAVAVWVHCGLHVQPRQPFGPACTPPRSGEMPPVDVRDKHFQLFPLRRDEGGSTYFSVRTFCAEMGGDLSGIGGRWVVELTWTEDADRPLRFCAASREDAEAWRRQFRMRAAPWAEVWARNGDVMAGVIGVGTTRGVAASASRLSTVEALAQGARHVLDNEFLAGAAGLAEALTQEEAYKLAVAAGPGAGLALEVLCFGLRVFAAARSAPGAAASMLDDLTGLRDLLSTALLPALKVVDRKIVDVAHLVDKLGGVVSDVEALAGDMHHLLRSRRQRVRLGLSAAGGGLEVGSGSAARLTQIRDKTDLLLQLIQVALQRQVASVAARALTAAEEAGPMAKIRRAMRHTLPSLPPNLFHDWDDPELPASQLYAAVMSPKATSCAAVGAHGMGGVGKTMACLLVAHRVEKEEDGLQRFSDGVHWVQLRQGVDEDGVLRWLCRLAATLAGKPIDATDLSLAAERLHDVLDTKACLIVVDDVWDDRWAAAFLKALDGVAASSLLLSTRQQDVATRACVSRPVSIDKQLGAAGAKMLLSHARHGSTPRAGKSDEAYKTDKLVEEAVSLCDGQALALSVMGAFMRDLGWAEALDHVRQQRNVLLSKGLELDGQYRSLWLCLHASYIGLDVDSKDYLWRNRFKALCVVRSKEQMPWTALAALWGEDKQADIEQIVRTLRSRSLVALQGEGPGETLCLSLHDLVVEFLGDTGLMGQAERAAFHVDLVSGYCRRNGIAPASSPTTVGDKSVALRPLWTLPSDNYVERVLAHLLVVGGAAEELGLLLCDMRFIAWRVKLGGGTCGIYRADGRGLGVGLLDRVATVVEGALAMGASNDGERRRPLATKLQQAAFELVERFRSRGMNTVAAADAADAAMRAYLCDTAHSFLEKPTVTLCGASRLDEPLERRVFPAGINTPLCTVVSSDGAVLLVTCQEGNLLVWEEESGLCRGELVGHTSRVTCLAVVGAGGGTTGARVVSGSYDNTVRVWDVEAKSCVATLVGHTDTVWCLAVVVAGGGCTGARVVSGSCEYTALWSDMYAKTRDNTVRVWDVDAKSCVATLAGHTSRVTCLAVVGAGGGTTGARVVSGSDDHAVRVWDVDAKSCVATLAGHTRRVTCLAVVGAGGGSTGARVVSGSFDRTVRLWDVDAKSCVATLAGHAKGVSCLVVVGAGRGSTGARVVSGSDDNTVRVWDADTQSCVATLAGHANAVSCLAVVGAGGDSTGARVASGSYDMTVRVWDVDAESCVATLAGHTNNPSYSAVVGAGGARTGARVVSGSGVNTVRVWDGDANSRVAAPAGHTRRVTCLAVVGAGGGSTGARVVSGSFDRTVRVWDVDSKSCVATLAGHTDAVWCLAVVGAGGGTTGARVVSGSFDRTVRLWDVDAKSCVATLAGHTDTVWCLAVVGAGGGSTGARVVSGSDDNTVRVWDADTKSCVATLAGHTSRVTCLAVVGAGGGSTGARVVSGSDDHTVRVWDVDAKSCVARLAGHTDAVWCLAVVGAGGGSTGARVVSGSFDRTVRVWDLDTKSCVATLAGHTNTVCCLAVVGAGGGSTGARVVSGSADNTVRVWDVDAMSCVATLAAYMPVERCTTAPMGCAPFSGLANDVGAIDATGRDGEVVFLDSTGCLLMNCRQLSLRHLPCPPHSTAVVCPVRGCIVWGTSTGRMYWGRFLS